MRSKLLNSLRLCSPSILLVFAFVGPAAIRPSFALDYCAWHATHVVLVEVTSEGAVFGVIESWKGNLEAGERITVPELKPSRGAQPISLYPRRTDIFAADESGINEHIPWQPAGSRLVLFLKREASFGAPIAPSNAESMVKWRPADLFGEMKASAVWIDGGKLYSFQQRVNPGPSILTTQGDSLQEMNDRVREISRIQGQMMQVVRIENSGARAEALKPYVGSTVAEAKRLALSELGKCGPAAVPTIHGMLDDRAFADETAELIKVFAEVGGDMVGEELNHRLQESVAFWQAKGPSLPQGWWNADATPHAPLREKYMLTLELIRGLERTHYTPALSTAKQVGDLWRSLPQLNDPSRLNQMVEESEKLVDHLRVN